MSISIRVLGALSVEISGAEVVITARNQRRTFHYLTLRVNEVVSVDQLADAVWRDNAPPKFEHAVHSLVYRLRNHLVDPTNSDGFIRRADPGYCLTVDPDAIDSHRFTDATRRGRVLLATDPAAAREVLVGGLSLWRGDALLDVAYDAWACGEIRRLTETRLVACESVAEANIALGDAQVSIAELESLTERFPTRESLWELLWRAMAATGRHIDVTASHRRATELLAESCSLQPTPQLAELARVYAEAE